MYVCCVYVCVCCVHVSYVRIACMHVPPLASQTAAEQLGGVSIISGRPVAGRILSASSGLLYLLGSLLVTVLMLVFASTYVS